MVVEKIPYETWLKNHQNWKEDLSKNEFARSVKKNMYDKKRLWNSTSPFISLSSLKEDSSDYSYPVVAILSRVKPWVIPYNGLDLLVEEVNRTEVSPRYNEIKLFGSKAEEIPFLDEASKKRSIDFLISGGNPLELGIQRRRRLDRKTFYALNKNKNVKFDENSIENSEFFKVYDCDITHPNYVLVDGFLYESNNTGLTVVGLNPSLTNHRINYSGEVKGFLEELFNSSRIFFNHLPIKDITKDPLMIKMQSGSEFK